MNKLIRKFWHLIEVIHYKFLCWKLSRNFFYWLRTHTINKYHMIDCRNTQNGYNWGWFDRSELMLFACFKILSDFMEREYPGCVDWEYDEDHRVCHKEMKELYHWWKVERPNYVRETSDFPNEKDQEMLKRLIEIRGMLWT